MSKLFDGTPAPTTLDEVFALVKDTAGKLERESARTKGKMPGGISAESQAEGALRELTLHEGTMSSAAQRLFEIMQHVKTITAKPPAPPQEQPDLKLVADNGEDELAAKAQMG